MRLALGTVQFGLAYGAMNRTGAAVTEPQVAAILDAAEAAGIDMLDTARGYGASEAVLGRLGAAGRFGIVTKVAALDGAGADGVKRSVAASLAALGTDRLAGLMLHRAADLDDAVWRALEAMPAERIGLSVYTPGEALTALDRYPVRLLQLPMNLLDRRFAQAGVLDRARAAGCAVHARSVFLQGTLLADPDALPTGLARLRPAVAALAPAGTPLRRAQVLAPVLADARIDRLLVGVDDVAQLDAIVAACHSAATMRDELDHLATDDETIVDPRLWPVDRTP